MLNTYNFGELTEKDYIIVLAGTNDINPLDFKIDLGIWFKSVIHANIIVSEIPYNNNLNENKLNNELRYICLKYKGLFVNMGYSRFVHRNYYFTVNICRYLLKEILRIDYKIKFATYIKQNRVLPKLKTNKSTQTYNLPGDFYTDQTTQTYDIPEDIVNSNLSLYLDKTKTDSSNIFRV